MKQQEQPWYQLNNPDIIDSPALLVYKDRAINNIRKAIAMVPDISLLRPHVKTNKTLEVAQLMLAEGVHSFKCATIAEAEMLALAGAKDILLAYQPVGPKAHRFVLLIKKYPAVLFSCLVDHPDIMEAFEKLSLREKITFRLYIDLNAGMNRTGILSQNAFPLYEAGMKAEGIEMLGLHVYDGHIRNPDLEERKSACVMAFKPVYELAERIVSKGFTKPEIIAGGTPTFSVHSKEAVTCSPGTFVYWDKGYHDILPEQPFEYAALVLTRVISLPADGKICVDLGHKSIAAENPMERRVFFLNAPTAKPISQSEEHLVLDVGADHFFLPGDVLYGVPYHICPTVALYDTAQVIVDGNKINEWNIVARNRSIEV